METSLQEKEILYIIFAGIAAMLFLALLVVIIFNISRQRILKEKNLNQQLQISHKEDLIKNNILTQEAERKRIAKDLHDEVGGKLNVVRLYINQLKKAVDNPARLDKIINDSKTLIDDTIATTRRISHDLLPPVLEELGLLEAINEYIKELRQATSIKIEFSSNDEVNKRLDLLTETQVFRVMQELVNNAVKHAEPNKIQVFLNIDSFNTNLKIVDDGKGFEISDFSAYKGLGLRNIKSRIELIGGRTTFKSTPNEGTEIDIDLESTFLN